VEPSTLLEMFLVVDFSFQTNLYQLIANLSNPMRGVPNVGFMKNLFVCSEDNGHLPRTLSRHVSNVVNTLIT
jgi:hypothetical protein